MSRPRGQVLAILTTTFALLLATGAAPAGVRLGRSVVSAGGGVATGTGRIAVTTAGQPVAAAASGLGRRVCSGWWCVEHGAVTAIEDEPATDVPVLAFAAPFPNPTTDALQIVFSLPRAAAVRLEVLDVAGRRVSTVAIGPFGPGRHATQWNGRGADGARVATGIYFVRLTVDGRSVATHRVGVMR